MKPTGQTLYASVTRLSRLWTCVCLSISCGVQHEKSSLPTSDVGSGSRLSTAGSDLGSQPHTQSAAVCHWVRCYNSPAVNISISAAVSCVIRASASRCNDCLLSSDRRLSLTPYGSSWLPVGVCLSHRCIFLPASYRSVCVCVIVTSHTSSRARARRDPTRIYSRADPVT